LLVGAPASRPALPGNHAELYSQVAGLQSRALGELILDLLSPDPAHRPDPWALLRGLGLVAGQSLELSVEELRGDYFPRPPLLGRERALEQWRGLLEQSNGQRLVLVRLTGCGRRTFLRHAVAVARLEGCEALRPRTQAELLDGLGVAASSNSQGQLATLVVDRLLATREEPLVLALSTRDDNPLAAPVLEQLERLALGGARLPAGLLVVHDGQEASGPWKRLHLPALDPAEVLSLARAMLYDRDDPRWLGQLYPLTGGDPRAVVELLHGQIEAGLDGPPQVSRGLLESLSETERLLLRVLACSPVPMPPPVVARVAPGALAGLGNLIARGLVLTTDRGLQLAGAAPATAQDVDPALHRALADAWSETGQPDPVAMAHHLLRTGAALEAAPWLVRSTAPAEQDLIEVAGLLPDDHRLRPAVLARLAHIARRRLGELDRALELADEIAGHDPTLGGRLRVELLLDAGQPTRALSTLETLSAPVAHDPLLQARGAALLGDFGTAADEARRGLQRDPESAERVQLQNVLGLSQTYLGRPAAGLEVLEAALREARELGDHEILARVLNSCGIALQRLGRLDQALAVHRECAGLYRELGDLRLAAASALNLGALAHRQMDLQEALAQYRHAASLGQRGALQATSAWAAASEANLLLLCGEVAAAEAQLARATDLAGADRSLGGHLTLYRAEARRMRGRLDEAERLVQQARELFDPGDRPGREAVEAAACELALLRGDLPGARRAVAALLELSGGAGDDACRTQLLAGRTELAAGRPDLAVEALQRALLAEVPRGRSEHGWQVHAALATALRLLGDGEAAERHDGLSDETLAALRRCVPPQHRAAFDARPDVAGRRALPRTDEGEGPSVAGMQRLLAINRELGQALNHGTTPEQLLERILDGALELAGAERGLILLRRSGRLRVVTSRGGDRAVERFSRSIAEQVVGSGEAVILPDAASDPRFGQGLSVAALQLRAVLCLPLQVQDAPGALYLDSRFGSAVAASGTVALAQAFADQAGIVMHSARLLAETAEQREQLARARAELEELNRSLADRVAIQSEQLAHVTTRLEQHEQELVRRYNARHLIGRSKPMRALFLQIERVAAADIPVCIQGESGTGKELVARAIHQAGPHTDRPFVAVNCGAVPATLLESELFGHARGAFTGAGRERAGVFEAAGDGTLLLDEVGDMEPAMQVKLLRVLQEGTFRRLGEDEERHSRCRVIAASHRRLDQLVAEGRFREDLFYRLNVIEIHVPPLRQRREDIPLLVQRFLQEAGPAAISPDAMRLLMDHDWPGNVRQLENEVRRAALLSDGRIEPRHLSPALRGAAGEQEPPRGLQQALRHHERRLIEEALQQTGFNVSRAARLLEVHRVALHRKLRQHGIGRR